MVYVLLIDRLFNTRCRDTYVDKVFLRKTDLWNYLEKQYYKFLNTILGLNYKIEMVYINSICLVIYYRNDTGDRCYLKYVINERSVS